MSLELLKQKILSRTACIGVIGLGYVGLPVAAMFADIGFRTVGIDIKADRINIINSGLSPIQGDEPGLEELIKRTIQNQKLLATTDYAQIRQCDVILVDVETPVDDQNIPRYEALKSALTSLSQVLEPGVLVIIESTIAPGTMQSVVLPILEHNGTRKVNQDFYLGNCPERVMPGKLLANLRSMSRVVGGGNQETADVMILLYKNIVNADLDAVDWITAELVKTTENAYRDVQIAFANEVAMICEAVGGDVWKVRELVNKSPYRNMHLPGSGVGGHCIPKDPWLLAYGVRSQNVPLKIIPSARYVNDLMPIHVADLLQDALKEAGKSITGSKILVLGYAYLENSDDTRNSPSQILVNEVIRRGGSVGIHDPYVEPYQTDLYQLAANCDAAIIMVAHHEYKIIDWEKLKQFLNHPIVIDGRHVVDPVILKQHNYILRVLGSGSIK